MRIKIISAITALLMTATVLGAAVTADGFGTVKNPSAGSGNHGVTDTVNTGSTTLDVIKYGDKLTQDQVSSRIKAEYLIKNGGYKDTDEVVVMVSVDGQSLIETYNDGATTAKSVAEYGESFSGKVQTAQNLAKQNEVIAALKAKGLIKSVEYNYTTVLNAFAVTTEYGNVKKIEKAAGVKSVALSDTYNQITTQASDASNVPSNVVDIDKNTGIYNNTSEYTGLGTVTAVLDSGFDMSHRVFDRKYSDEDREKLIIKKSGYTDRLSLKSSSSGEADKIVLSDLNAGQTTKNLLVKDVWYSDKIPFAYDYADKDPDVFPYDSEHGTHVAGIIAGEDEVIHGIAPDTQLVLMKVFMDLDSGGRTEDIIAALEDAVKLNVDAINMSLGSSCGFAREFDNDPDKPNVAKVYDAINDSGISLITAASNSYSAGFGGEQGNTNFTSNPDSGTVGAPSTYDAALSVASISGELSRYIKTSENKMFFYGESSDVQKVEQNKFYEELVEYLKDDKEYAIKEGQDNEFQLVEISGVGAAESYSDFEMDYLSKHPGAVLNEETKKEILKGKIVLVERGTNSFEEKARVAREYGAVACIIYNNIDGDIAMSMGSNAHIPTISVSKDDGKMLVKEARAHGGEATIYINSEYLAGPFMSDFSSWGPTPSLGIKPEITAHGGNIKSAVPGRDGDEYRYDKLSGTSMATPNLCGIVVLIRQYLKDNYGDRLTAKEIKNLTNQLMMSTAGIAINEENNPYSPRKQGAGLADIGRTTTTTGYITVDGSDRTKLELYDDPSRSGVYEMKFNVVNMSEKDISYDFSLVGMTESVSTSDDKHVAETPYLLTNDNVTVEFVSGNGSVSGNRITVKANAAGTDATEWNKVSVKVTYRLSAEDKKYIEKYFENGMYVEGFVKLAGVNEEIDLNAPFLAFYGDWTEAPMFDKTYYEVESTAHDPEIDDDDKIKADYYATTPYGQYFYNYMIPLGTYLYDIDESKYSKIPASEDKIAISDTLGSIDGISVVLAGLLRGAKTMTFTITDKATGEELWSYIDYNSLKSFSQGGSPMPYYDYLRLYSTSLGLVNNRAYEFKMQGTLDYGDGGLTTNKRNSYSFDFTLDNEAPVIKKVEYRKEYDSSDEKDHYFMDVTVYDNQYAMSITPIIFTSSSSYTFLTKNPIPITNPVKGGDTTVSFEITDYLDDIYNDAIIPNALAFSVDDYALNSDIFLCQLPGTRGDFKFTRTGEKDSAELLILPVTAETMVDLTQYLYTADSTIGENRENAEYLKHLVWTSSDTSIIEVEQGLLKVKKAGRATVTVTEKYGGNQAVIIINAKPAEDAELVATALRSADVTEPSYQDDVLEDIRFSHFKTTFAYSRAAQTSEIGSTGDVNYVNATTGTISMYPGEKIRLYNQIKPWYVADKYELTYKSGNDEFVTVDKDGNVTALKEGSAYIQLKATDKTTGIDSPIVATITINVKSPFVIENRMLVAYKGTGDENGVVTIPDDEGILYIGSFAFCLYTTDKNVQLDDDDYDANKIPSSNDKITKVIIPEGVEEIQKYAFYNCTKLEEVVLPSTVKYIREYSFALNKSLSKIGINDGNGNAVEGKLNKDAIVVGAQAFRNCVKLKKINLSNVYAIGEKAFDGCTALESADLRNLRNTGASAFQSCTSLKTVQMNEHTKLSYAMFAGSGLESVTLYEKTELPNYLFANCYELKRVEIKNSLLNIGVGAFSRCVSLTDFVYGDGVTIDKFGDQTFYNATGLVTFRLPEGKTSLGNYCFYMDETDTTLRRRFPDKIKNKFTTLEFGKTTELTSVDGSVFRNSNLSKFAVDPENAEYGTSADGRLLTSKDGRTIYLAATGVDYGTYVVGEDVDEIASGAFSGVKISKLIVKNPDCKIGSYAFEYCEGLTEVILPENNNITIGDYAFAFAGTVKDGNDKVKGFTVENIEYVKSFGSYAFRTSGIKNVVLNLENGTKLGEGVFFESYLESATVRIGEGGGELGLGVFQSCGALVKAEFVRTEGTNGELKLGDATFTNSKNLTKIVFDNVTEVIPMQMFYGCTKLETAELYGVKTIENGAFANCSALSAVVFTKENGEETLETIGDGAFAGYKLTNGPIFTTITLPSTLRNIGEGAFFGCYMLREITVPDEVSFPSNVDTKDGDAADLMHFNGNYLFYGCSSLEKVTLGGSATRVGKYMFAMCNALKTVNLDNVDYIGDYAFTQPLPANRDDVSVLNGINISEAKYIGEAAFMNCTALSGQLSAGSLKEVGAYAFKNTNIEDFFAYKLEKIGNNAFESITNKNFREFTVTENLKSVGEAAFYGCTYLRRFKTRDGESGYDKPVDLGSVLLNEGSLYVKLKNGNRQLSSVPANLRDEDDDRTEYLNVYEGTTRIDAFAGNQNDQITDIIFPESLEYIGNYAFYGYRGRNVELTVHFSSYKAPVLENKYNSNLKLDEKAAGYGLLHAYPDIFQYELCYCNFVALAGSVSAINMVLPSNENLEGYDSLIYEAYFGKVEEASRSGKIVMDKYTSEFLKSAREIKEKLGLITLSDEKTVTSAITAMNAAQKQKEDCDKFGVDIAEWEELEKVLADAKEKIRLLKLDTATDNVKSIEEAINALPETFDIGYLETLRDITLKIDELTAEERNILSNEKFSAFSASFANYLNSVEEEAKDLDELSGFKFKTSEASASANAADVTGIGSLSGLLAIVLKKRFF